MRILLASNSPWIPSGFGGQTALLAPRLRDLGHEVVLFANHGLQGSPSEWKGITVLPAAFDEHGNDIIAAHAKYVKPDLVLVLADAWPHAAEVFKTLPAAFWLPVDTDRLAIGDEEFLRASGVIPIAMSRFGEKLLKAEGFTGTLYAPHAVDVQTFRPLADRDALREKWKVAGRFVIGIAAANKDGVRKGLSEQFAAFARFRKTHKDALLIVHSMIKFPTSQLDLERLAIRLGIRDDVRFTDQYAQIAGLMQPPHMAELYNIFDVISNTAYGEGFGVPPMEAMACGTPAILTDCSAMTELKGPGWLVQGEPFYNPVHEAWWCKPSIGGIARAYEKAYRGAASRRQQAREFAMTYDADAVLLEHWKPALDVLAERAAGGR